MASKYKPSIVQDKCECFLCHAPYTVGLDHHHLLHGTGQRKLADEDCLWVWLCRKCHTALHDHGIGDKELQATAQRTYLQTHTREEWFRRYGKYYE